MMDEDGYAHLDRFPVFIVIQVEADDMSHPVSAVWPEVVPEQVPDEVPLELEVDEGESRRVTVQLAQAAEGVAGIYISPAQGSDPLEVNVVAGETTEVEVELTELGTGTVMASWPEDQAVASLSWVDDEMGLILPPTEATGRMTTTPLAARRTYWPRVTMENGDVIDLPLQSISLDRVGESLDVSLEISE